MHNSQNALELQVRQATPQQRRLMLIDGAIRFAQRALTAWEQSQNDLGMRAVVSCRDIISELLRGVTPDGSVLARQITSVYVFLFQRLIEAQLRRDQNTVQDVIRVLEVERETWSLVCDHAYRVVSDPR